MQLGDKARHAGVDQHQPRHQRSCARLERAGQSLDRRMAPDVPAAAYAWPPETRARRRRRRPTTSALSWVASTPAARSRRGPRCSTSTGPSPAAMGTTTRRTSSRSGSARRTRSACRCATLRERHLWAGGATGIHREPPLLRWHVHQHLQRPLSRGQRRQLHRHLPLAQLQGASRSIGMAAGQWVVRLHGPRHPRRPLRWLDRARRSRRRCRRSQTTPPRWRFPSFFCEREQRRLLARSRRSRAATASSRSPTSTTSARSINVTSSQGPTRDARQQTRHRRAGHATSSPPTASRAPHDLGWA